MQTIAATQFILAQRTFYLNKFELNFSSLNPDTKGLIESDLLVSTVVMKMLGELVFLIDDQWRDSSRNRSPQRRENRQTLDRLLIRLRKHVADKKETISNKKALGESFCFDIWTKVFPKTADIEMAQDLFKASDHIEDLILLAELTSTFKFPEETTHLRDEIDAFLIRLDQYCALIQMDSDVVARIQKLFIEIKLAFETNNYQTIEELIQELKQIIRCEPAPNLDETIS